MRIGHFEIASLVARGGMGDVYPARDTGLQREVAPKVLPATIAADPERLSRFQREAETLASLTPAEAALPRVLPWIPMVIPRAVERYSDQGPAARR